MEKSQLIQTLTQIENSEYQNITEQDITELEYLGYIKNNTEKDSILPDDYILTESGIKFLENNK